MNTSSQLDATPDLSTTTTSSEELSDPTQNPTTSSNRWKQKWTLEERRYLKYHWGEIPIQDIAAKLNRTTIAVGLQAKFLKLGSPNKGTLSLAEVCRRSGYDVTRVRGAMRILRIRPRYRFADDGRKDRQPVKYRKYAFDSLDADRIVDFLAKFPDGKKIHFNGTQGAWGEKNKPACCRACQLTSRPHAAKGYCFICYNHLKNGAWGGQNKPLSCAWCGENRRPYAANNLCKVCYNRHAREVVLTRKKPFYDITLRCVPASPSDTCSVSGYVRPRRNRRSNNGAAELTEVCSGS